MPSIQTITPCLWFDDQAEAAIGLYISVFKNSRVTATTQYGEAGKEFHGKEPGTVMSLAFELDGQAFTAINGGPIFKFTEAISLQINCQTQAEVDHYWNKLGDGGPVEAQQCGWVKDKFGLSWQVVPTVVPEMLQDDQSDKAQRVFGAIMQMRKIDIAALQKAFAG